MRPVTFRPVGLPRFTEPELKARAPPETPVVHVTPLLEVVPLKPFPEESWTVVPLPSANRYQATGAGRTLTQTVAVPLMPAPVAVTDPVSWALPAANRPVAFMVPIPPLTDHATAGAASAAPN